MNTVVVKINQCLISFCDLRRNASPSAWSCGACPDAGHPAAAPRLSPNMVEQQTKSIYQVNIRATMGHGGLSVV